MPASDSNDLHHSRAGTAPDVGLVRIFFAFLVLGGTSFGGGTAAWLHREMVVKRGWLDDSVFLEHMTLGQAIPGSNGIKLTVLIGDRLRGTAGACVALLGLLMVPFVLSVAIAAAYGGFGAHPVVQAMLDGAAAAVIGLTFAAGLQTMVQGAPGPAAWSIGAITVVCVGVLGWPMFPVILVVAPVSIAIAAFDGRRRRHA
jgi:chromate transporter